MAENDEASGSEAADTPYVPTGLRRSTFTPPSDEAAQAAALSSDGAASDGAVPPVAVPRAAASPEPLHPSSGQQTTEQQTTEQPAPDSAPDGFPDRPRRRSLADDDLVRKLSSEAAVPGATLGAIEELQAQLLLRQEEARRFGEWESGMRAIGTPEALDSIAQAIPEFTGVIPIVSPEQNADYLAAGQPPVQSDARGEAQSLPAVQPPAVLPEPPSVQYMNPEAYPPPRAEERVDAAPLEEPNLSDHLVFQPPWKRTPSPEESLVPPEAPESPEMQESVEAQKPEAQEPEAAQNSQIPQEVQHSEEPPRSEPAAAELLVPEEPESVPLGGRSAGDEAGADASDTDVPVIYELVDPPPSGSVPISPPSALLFEQLLSGVTAEPIDEIAAPFPLLEVPQPGEPTTTEATTTATEATTTASQAIVLPIIEDEPDDDVDEIDRAFGEPSDAAVAASETPAATGGPAVSDTGAAPIQPLASPRVQTGEQVLVDEEPPKQPVFSLELSGIEPTPLEHRVGRAARMFWLWFATNASVVSVAFGAALLGLGMSLRQAILAAFIGVAISFLPLGLGTLAGKWSGQPTIVVSRATFGLVGNIVPAVLALLTRLFWGAVLLWLLAVCTARILVGASLSGPFTEMQLTLVVVAVGFVLAFLVAFLGYPLFARLQLILSIVSAVLIVGLFVVTWNTVDIRAALSIGDGPWILVTTGVVLVFSFIGLVWANGSGDVARYQRSGSSGASASLWASFGATLPAFLLIAYGALLAASSPSLFKGFQTIPLDTIAGLIPTWYPVPLIAATALSLLSAVALSLYSGGFALQAVGVRLGRQWAVVAVGVAIFGVATLMVLSDAGFADVFRDLATSVAVPVAAWAGIFAAEMMIRRRHFDTGSLLRPGGVYPGVNWINLAMLFVASALGFAFTSAAVGWLSWQGYGFALLGIPLGGPVGASDLGVLVALAIGLLTPLVVGVPAVRRQESALR